ncbi:hypothetical protein ACFWIA_00040 [Streptomyces sp. NPDC127068]|uniref:hypothetical protein n=1 Tax=Streptomyces sp. NPDC127068 TaxID=3347127 RepID=UPI003662DAC4
MRRVLWIEARRGETKWVAAVLAAVGLLYFTDGTPGTSDWIGWWAQTAVRVQLFAVIVMGPLTAAATAWTAGRAHRFRTLGWTDTTPRDAWNQGVVLWLAALLWVLPVYALLALVAHRRTAAVSEVTDPAWTPLLLGAAVLALHAACGTTAGSLLPTRITAPLAGLCGYGVLVALALTGTGGTGFPGALIPVIDQHWDMAFRPRADRLLTATVWCLSAAVVLLALPALCRATALRPRRWLLASVTAVALTAAGALLAHRPTHEELAWAERTPQPDRPVCATSGGTRACLWPDDRHLLPALRGAVRDVDELTASVPGLNRTFHERGLRPDGPRTGELPVHSPGTDRATMTDDMLAAALPQSPSGCSVPPLRGTGGYPTTFFLEAVVSDRTGTRSTYWGETFAAAVERFRQVPRDRQDAWISATADGIRTCGALPPLPKGPAA